MGFTENWGAWQAVIQPQSAPAALFFCCQQEAADLGVGPVQGELPAGHAAPPALSSHDAPAPSRLGNGEHFSVGQGNSKRIRRWGWWTSTSYLTMSRWSRHGASIKNLRCPSPILTGFDPPCSTIVQPLILSSLQQVLLHLKCVIMLLQYLAICRAYLYGTCSSLSCRHMSTGLPENLRMVSKWTDVSSSIWLLRAAWRNGPSSSAWKSMVRLPL